MCKLSVGVVLPTLASTSVVHSRIKARLAAVKDYSFFSFYFPIILVNLCLP